MFHFMKGKIRGSKLIFLWLLFFIPEFTHGQVQVCKEPKGKFEFSYYGYEVYNNIVTLRIGVKNNQKFNVSHVAFQLPVAAKQALNPKNENPNYEYTLENTTKNPFGHSLKFNVLNAATYNTGGVDVFSYQLTLSEFNSMTSFKVLAKAGLQVDSVSFNPLGCCASQVTISGPNNICSGSTQSYSVTPITGANTYIWKAPAGWQIVSGQGTNTVSVTNNGQTGEISIQQGISSCGKLKVDVNNTAIAAPGPITGPDTVCKNGYYFYQVPAIPNVNYYLWTVPAGWQIMSATTQGSGYSNKILVKSGTSTGQIKVAAVGQCLTSTTTTMVAFALPVSFVTLITGALNPCSGKSERYSVAAKNGSSYTWTVPSGYTILSGQGSNTITVRAGRARGPIEVTAKDKYYCGSASTYFTVDPAPSLAITTNPQPVNSTVGSTITFTGNATGTALVYKWQVNYGAGWLNISENNLFRQTASNSLQITNAPIYLNDSQFRMVVSRCDSAIYSAPAKLVLSQTGTIANIKVLLEGPYNATTGLMRTTLNSLGLLPSLNPYRSAPWNFAGQDSVPKGFLAAHPDIVDWVLVEIRNNLTPGSRIATKALLLRSDGNIVDLDGKSLPVLSGVSAGNYFLVVNHRNHLAIISKTSTPLSLNSVQYDFTSTYLKSYGVNPIKKMTNNKWAMFTGDADGNGSVSTSDWNIYYRSETGQSGYLKSDWNMDGTVGLPDYNMWYVNGGATTQVLR
jgi:hypothetical protein